MARFCPQAMRPGQGQQQTSNPHNVGLMRCNAMNLQDRACYLKVRINDNKCECLLDTGSDVSVLPLSYVKGCQIRPTGQTLKAANGINIPVLGEATAKITTPKLTSTVTAVISEHIMEPMIGVDWLCQNEACLLYTSPSPRDRQKSRMPSSA